MRKILQENNDETEFVMNENIDIDVEFQKFEIMSEELNRMTEEIDSDCKALDEAQMEADKIKQLEKQLKENPSVSDADKIKQEIAERTDKIEQLLATIKPAE